MLKKRNVLIFTVLMVSVFVLSGCFLMDLLEPEVEIDVLLYPPAGYTSWYHVRGTITNTGWRTIKYVEVGFVVRNRYTKQVIWTDRSNCYDLAVGESRDLKGDFYNWEDPNPDYECVHQHSFKVGGLDY